MSEPERVDAAVEAEIAVLIGLVRCRYGDRLSAEQLDGVRKGVQGIVEGARSLRAVVLKNADEPFQPFAPFRAEP